AYRRAFPPADQGGIRDRGAALMAQAEMSARVMRFVDTWRLGHVASIGPAGPNVSPKGTFQALSPTELVYAEIRSPQTRENIAHDPRVEVNMVDVFSRQGARFRGEARFEGADSALTARLMPRWQELFGAELAALIKGFVVIELSEIRPLKTPAYDVGAEEAQLRRDYLARFTAMQREALGE
ncbi:MAG: pyridoxamine 5'-phosphate oxidase family protein, partial [Pseudomonadota bacterium]